MSQVPATQPVGGEVEVWDPDGYATGLEDFDIAKDAVMPRLVIDHKSAKFKDSLSNEEFDVVEGILLGIHKGRVLWDDDVQDDATPMCKSYNFSEGIPDVAQFPWGSSGFDPTAFQGREVIALPCDGCALKEWNTHPKRENAPWCGEQHTFPILMNIGTADDPAWAPALFTVQRTGLRNSRAYVSAFARAKVPLFSVRTQLTLRAQRRGSVEWAVPEFRKLGPTEREDWPEWSRQFVAIKNFISTPRIRDEEEVAVPQAVAETETDQPQQQTVTPAASTAPPVTQAASSDLPF